MSALARHFLREGKRVFGYDKVATTLTKSLEDEGAHITYAEQLSDFPGWPPEHTTVIYTPAIPKDNLWMQHFGESYSPVKRAFALAQIANEAHGIAIAGTHGKTTTAALLTHILRHCGQDPTAFVGGIMTATGSNYVHGNGPWVVLEADEFDRSFLHLKPHMACITTTDADHLDIYGDSGALNSAFEEFVAATKAHQGPVVSGQFDGVSTARILAPGESPCRDGYYATNPTVEDGAYVFDLVLAGNSASTRLPLPGKHNVYNALLAATLAYWTGCSVEAIAAALPSFEGIERRFQIHCTAPKTLIEDYAHHPTELNALIDALEELYPGEEVALFFQPHLYSRTRDFADGFTRALERVGQPYLVPIYPARELPIEGVSSEALANAARVEIPVITAREIPTVAAQISAKIIVIAGAGDIGNQALTLKQQWS